MRAPRTMGVGASSRVRVVEQIRADRDRRSMVTERGGIIGDLFL